MRGDQRVRSRAQRRDRMTDVLERWVRKVTQVWRFNR